MNFTRDIYKLGMKIRHGNRQPLHPPDSFRKIHDDAPGRHPPVVCRHLNSYDMTIFHNRQLFKKQRKELQMRPLRIVRNIHIKKQFVLK